MADTTRVRVIITRLDLLSPRLWTLVRQDLSRQMREYFHYAPDLGLDQDEVTVAHVGVTPAVARVGLHAPAFVQAVANMLRAYALPQRFHVSVAILTLAATITRQTLVQLQRSTEPAPAIEGVGIVGVAEELVDPGATNNA